jgi:hypothetical protein
MKREWFSRGVRMSHKFGNTEKLDDPMQTETFDLKTPDLSRTGGGRSPPCELKDYGQNIPGFPDRSPIQKPSGGFASTQGPTPDGIEPFSRPVPVGTKRRIGPPRTDK